MTCWDGEAIEAYTRRTFSMVLFFTTTISVDFSASSDYFTEYMKEVHTLFQMDSIMHNVLLKLN